MNYQVYINGLLSSAVITGTCHNLINTELDSNTSYQNNFPSYMHDLKVHPTSQYQPIQRNVNKIRNDEIGQLLDMQKNAAHKNYSVI